MREMYGNEVYTTLCGKHVQLVLESMDELSSKSQTSNYHGLTHVKALHW